MATMGNLRVVIVPDGKFWFAQGLEIDYGAQGDTAEEAKAHFFHGLAATLALHQERFGHIDGVLRVAPDETWREMYKVCAESKIDMHITGPHGLPIPFDRIEYSVVQANEERRVPEVVK
jgi:hypothetical protein